MLCVEAITVVRVQLLVCICVLQPSRTLLVPFRPFLPPPPLSLTHLFTHSLSLTSTHTISLSHSVPFSVSLSFCVCVDEVKNHISLTTSRPTLPGHMGPAELRRRRLHRPPRQPAPPAPDHCQRRPSVRRRTVLRDLLRRGESWGRHVQPPRVSVLLDLLRGLQRAVGRRPCR